MVLIYFGKVLRKSNVCIIQFDWLIALYIFISLFRNMSFIIVKPVVAGKKSVMSTNHYARTHFWWVRACAPHLWLVHLSNWHFSLHLPPLQRPRHVHGWQFSTLEVWQSPDKFTVKRKTKIKVYVYIYIVHRIRGQQHSSIYRKVLTCHR